MTTETQPEKTSQEHKALKAQQEGFKNRLVGALIWLGALVWIVPDWYANPVGFDPDTQAPEALSADTSMSPQTIQPKGAQPSDQATSQSKADAKNGASNGDSDAQAQTDQPRWILRLVAYRTREQARDLAGQLEYDYQVFIKYFPESRYYSVRSGPYTDHAHALSDQKKLNQMLNIESQLVKIQPDKSQ